MADCIILGSGSGGESGDCTADRSKVLASYTAVTRDSNDDPAEGTMPDNGDLSATLAAGQSKTIPAGYTSGGTVTAKDLASQTKGTVDAAHMVKGYSGYANGKEVSGAIEDRGPYQYAGGIGEAGDYYAFNNMPNGWYHESNEDSSWAPEVRLAKSTVRNYLGIAANKIVNGQSIAGISGNGGYSSVACIASHSANVGGNRDSDGRKSFRMPRAGCVFYGGATAGTSGSFICAIFKNGTCIDDRNMRTSGYAHGYGDYTYRGSMFNQSFYANAGDLIEVETSYGGSNTQSSIQAVILY